MIESGGLNESSTSVIPKSNSTRKFSSDIEFVNPNQLATKLFYKVKKKQPVMAKTCNTDNDSVKDEIDKLSDPTNQEITKEDKPDESESDMIKDEISNLPFLKLNLASCGLPLQIFTNGSFCHPYLSITYLDILNDPRVRSFVIGATNILFKQKKSLFDVIVEVDGAKIEINDPELKKCLNLSTEDLRFADYLVKSSLESSNLPKANNLNQSDKRGWEGCDEWLRYNFKVYLLHLLRTSECNGKFFYFS